MRKSFIVILSLLFAMFAAVNTARAQTVVDKMVASVSDGVRTELITYSDLLWQLALQPASNLDAPSKEELNAVLQRLIEQRLIALESERLPAAAPTEEEIQAEVRRLVAAFPSAAVFESRLRLVGFESAADPNFRRIIEQRLAIQKYLDFRFRSFIVITTQDEERYYNETFVPEFRRLNPGIVVPALDTVRAQIQEQLTETRIESEIERFLSEARERAVITTLNPI
jgi:hypothetical protein